MTPSSIPVVHRTGEGRPLVLVHGLGASHDCWRPVLALLAAHRQVVTFDLPGFGTAAPLAEAVTVPALTDFVERLLRDEQLLDADLVGSSMGAEVVLELALRGHGGHVVAIAPSGYWNRPERAWFALVAWTAVVLVTLLRPLVPAIIGSRVGRVLLLLPLSPRPARLPDVTRDSTHLFARTPSFLPALRWLIRDRSPVQVPPVWSPGRRLTVAWGRRDGLCLPRQAGRALAALPGARLHWFERSGHLPLWDEPAETAGLLLEATG